MGRYLVLLVFFCAVAAGASRVLSRAPSAQRTSETAAAADLAKPADGSPVTVLVDGDLRGHFTVHPLVDGKRTTMLVDTGASVVALTYEDALAAGYKPKPADYRQRISTANGIAAAAPVRIGELRIGGIMVRGVEAVVMPRGALGRSLLGMSFLRRLDGFEVQSGLLRLRG